MREHYVDNSHVKEIDPEWLHEEYDFGVGYALRWLMYEFTEDGVNFHDEALGHLGLAGHEDILDIGCGMGRFLKSIEETGHEGKLMGLDYTNSLQYAIGRSSIRLVQADASCHGGEEQRRTGLPFTDNSFDIASALFMLYHVSSPESTLREMTRIVKPGGKIAVATSGRINKEQHRRFESELADEMGVSKPARYTKNFTVETADELLPKLFHKIERPVQQRTRVVIREDDTRSDPFRSMGVLGAYITSLKSMAKQFGKNNEERVTAASRLNEAIGNVVLPEICRQINETGEFAETIHRELFICSDPK